MLTFTETARRMVLSFMEEGFVERPALRLAMRPGSPFAPQYELSLVEDDAEPGDVVVDAGGFRVLLDADSAAGIQGSTVDYVERDGEEGFDVRNPNVKPLGAEAPAGPMAERVQHVIEQQVNPAIAAHGGRITLVDVRDNVVYLEMSGGCQGCGMARVTLRQGVERMIREAVPEIVGIEDVTDHAAGETPYYQRT